MHPKVRTRPAKTGRTRHVLNSGTNVWLTWKAVGVEHAGDYLRAASGSTVVLPQFQNARFEPKHAVRDIAQADWRGEEGVDT
jgi:hypothetical protein